MLLALTAAGMVAVLVVWAARLGSSSDRFAAAGVVLTGGTFALLAAGLAAVAFAQSIRRPRLGISVLLLFPTTIEDGGHNRVAVSEFPGAIPQFPLACWLPNGGLRVDLSNDGEASARNVTVYVIIEGLYVLELPELVGGWQLVSRDLEPPRIGLAWEGGADYAVHPRVGRNLPEISFKRAAACPGSGAIDVSAFVEGDGSPGARDTHKVVDVLAPGSGFTVSAFQR